MVRAGEASGALDLVLGRLAEYAEHQEVLRGRFKAAMVYPIVMSVVGAFVLFFLVAFVVPNITKIFEEMQQALPLPTILLITVSNVLKSFWWAFVLVGVVVVVAVKQFANTPKGHYVWDKVKLKMPALGDITQKMAVARFSRTLGTLLESGVPLLSALEIVRNIVNNELIGEAIDSAAEEIEAGKSLAIPLGRSQWFPAIAVQMISVGEQSGELESMLNKIADTYEREVESRIMAMTTILEPAMILVMAGVVAFIIISILFPILEMNQIVR